MWVSQSIKKGKTGVNPERQGKEFFKLYHSICLQKTGCIIYKL